MVCFSILDWALEFVIFFFVEGKVIIIIGGDNNYKNKDEEDRVVISRWARRKITSQFREEFLDGSKSFIFSWNKQHRAIHEEALLHYFAQSGKEGQKFEYHPKPKQPVNVQSAQTHQKPMSTASFPIVPKTLNQKRSNSRDADEQRYNRQLSNLGNDEAPGQREQRPLSTKTEG